MEKWFFGAGILLAVLSYAYLRVTAPDRRIVSWFNTQLVIHTWNADTKDLIEYRVGGKVVCRARVDWLATNKRVANMWLELKYQGPVLRKLIKSPAVEHIRRLDAHNFEFHLRNN